MKALDLKPAHCREETTLNELVLSTFARADVVEKSPDTGHFPFHRRDGYVGHCMITEWIRGSPCVDRTTTHNTHLSSTVCSQAQNAHTTRLAQELHCQLCAPEKNLVILVCSMSHPWLSHLPFTTSTSSSSFTLPSSTQEHAARSGQQEQLREHSVHPAHLQAPSVDKLRHQESLWREDLQSGGNPRTTTPTGYEPKELATVARIEAFSGDPHQLYDVREKVGQEDHRAPITQEIEEFREIGTAGLPDSKISETSCFQSQMHFDDSVESIADSDLEDGELEKMLTSPLYAQKASAKPDAVVMQVREVSAQYTQADRKESLRSHSADGNTMHCFHLKRET